MTSGSLTIGAKVSAQDAAKVYAASIIQGVTRSTYIRSAVVRQAERDLLRVAQGDIDAVTPEKGGE